MTASALIHVVYFLLIGRLYRNADLSVAYPLMRGLSPLVATVIAAATLREVPNAVALVGVLVLVVGVATMAVFSGPADGDIDRATLVVALFEFGDYRDLYSRRWRGRTARRTRTRRTPSLTTPGPTD